MNLNLLAPELSLGVTAVAVILLDLFLGRKWPLVLVSIVGLAVAAAFSAAMWGGEATNAFHNMLVVDSFSLFFKLLLLGIAALVILASVDYVSRFTERQGEYYALILLSTGGMMLLASARELITIFISVELTGIPLYVLAGFLKDPKSSEASLKYLLVGAISSAVSLYGMAMVFGLTGTTFLDEIREAIPTGRAFDNPALLLGIVFMIAGFGFKIAAFPFGLVVPDVYEGSPTTVAAFLSVAKKAAGLAVILRVFNVALGAPLGISLDWAAMFAVLSAISMTFGNLVAIAQTNIKRMLGYSSIAQAGYLMVGLATVTALGRDAVIFFMASYALTNVAAFIAITAISHRIDSDLISDYTGMARRAPLLALALAFCLISLTGIPVTAGFVSKVYIFNAAVQNRLFWLVIVGVINSIISAYYYLRVVKVMYIGEPVSAERLPSSWPLRIALFIPTVGVLIVGLLPSPLIQAAQTAAGVFSP